jgi:acyl carrier protein phosphodiesterase
MNLLAHLHLGRDLPAASAAGNFSADFCKQAGGDAYNEGAQFHRRIDAFTDSHALVAEARKLFPSEYRRFAGILVDLAFDHCLSRGWEGWMPDADRESFIDGEFERMLLVSDDLPEQAAQVIGRFAVGGWVHQYHQIDGLQDAIVRMAARRPVAIGLVGGHRVIAERDDELNAIFAEFYPQLQEHMAGCTDF